MASPLDDIFGPPRTKGSLLDDVFGPPKRPPVDASILGGLGIDPKQVRDIPDRMALRPPAQAGPAPDDSWRTTARKLLENYDNSLGTTIGGLLQSSGKIFSETLGDIVETSPGVGAAIGLASEIAPGAVGAAAEAGDAGLGALKRTGKGLYDRSAEELRRNAPNLAVSPGKQFVYDLGNVIADLGIATGASVATRSPRVGQAFMSARVFGSKFGESVAAGRTEDQAFQDATVHAVAEAVGEAAVISRFMKPGQKFGRKVVEGAVGEAVQEGLTSLIQNGYDAGIIGEKTTFGEFVRAVGYDMLLGGGGGGIVAGGTYPFARREVTAPGRIEAANIESDPTPEDVASPLPTDLVSEGKALMQGAAAKLEADKILARNAAPGTGTMVEIAGQRWTVEDAFADEAGEEGVTLSRDGQTQKVYFADLADAGLALNPVEAEGKLEPSPLDDLVPSAPATASAGRGRSRSAAKPAIGNRDQIIAFVMNDLEGGGQRVVDSGGVTRFGVSKDANPDVDVENLTAAGAAEVYRKRYWNPLMLGKSADPAFAMVAFDAAINHGVGRARQMMKAAGGDAGQLLAARRSEYARLIAQDPGQYSRYAKGWENRLKKLEAALGGVPEQAAAGGSEEAPPATGEPEASGYDFLNSDLLPEREMDQPAPPATDQTSLARMALESENPVASAAPAALDDGKGDGSRAVPRKVEVPEDLDIVAARVADPTEAQKEGLAKETGENVSFAYDKAQADEDTGISGVAAYQGEVPSSDRPRLSAIRSEGDSALLRMDERLSGVSSILGSASDAEPFSGPDRRDEGLRAGERPVGDERGAVAESARIREAGDVSRPNDDDRRVGARVEEASLDDLRQTERGTDDGAGVDGGQAPIGGATAPVDPSGSNPAAQDVGEAGRAEGLDGAGTPQAGLDGRASTVDARVGRFDPQPHVEKLRSYVANPRNPIGDMGRIAKRLGVHKLQARKVVSALASQPGSGLFMSRKGNLRRVPQRKGPVSLLHFLKDRGGFVAPPRHRLTTRGRDLHKSFPGMISANGMAFDEAMEAAVEAGYFPSRDTGTVTEDDFLQAIERAGGFYRPEDQAEVLEKRARAASAARPSERDRLDDALADPALTDFLPADTITDSDRDGILELMSEDPDGINADPYVAAPEYFVRRMAAVLDAGLAETDDSAYDVPFDIEVPRETGSEETRRGDGAEAAETGGGLAGEPGDAGGGSAAGPGRGEDGRVEPEQADAFGERPEDARVVLEWRGGGRKRSDRAQKPPGSDGGLFDSRDTQLDIEDAGRDFRDVYTARDAKDRVVGGFGSGAEAKQAAGKGGSVERHEKASEIVDFDQIVAESQYIGTNVSGDEIYEHPTRGSFTRRPGERRINFGGLAVPYDPGDATPIDQARAAMRQAMAALDAAAAPREAEPEATDERRLFSLSDPTSTPEFRRWFGDSKVVDENGAPLVVYHGTPRGKFEAFDRNAEPLTYASDRGHFFFSPNREDAEYYAADGDSFGGKASEPHVFSVYLSLQNPMVVTAEGDPTTEWDDTGHLHSEEAKRSGHDGIIIESESTEFDALYVAFEPSQIKSTDNRGTFDPNDPRMAFSLSGSGEEVFYSALERAIEASPTKRAPAAQWAATLGKTPGVRKEELEWSGLFDFLDMQTGPIDREALLQVVRDGGIKVEEVVLGGNFDETVREVMRRTGWTEEEAREELEDGYPVDDISGEQQFQSWSSDPSNDTYRELLITLPVGTGGNPDRAPSTHWDQEAVVAHARFMEKQDAEGKRVLFIEEVQSDWGQGLRDQAAKMRKRIDTEFQDIVERMKAAGVLKEVCD